ncbi:hypothetical protein CEP54_004240 [Fusarium duplospermum]|uniref:DUF202 domain-containing protein n=1 Tax=Fusarium duplospermum TaxID=1325734 RepID=A0A428QJJ9_9HYPO|nr:hypothetical protein CEP54_004240 [Fusarium duplospermum]
MAEDAAPLPAAPDPVVPALTGQSVSGRTPSNANANANANAASVNFQLSSGRRQSSNARINEILEVRTPVSAPKQWLPAPPPQSPPGLPGSPIFPPRTNSAVNPIIEDSSADEATGFIAHTPPLNYNSVTPTTTNNVAVTSGARVRKTSTRSSHRSRPLSRHQSSDAHPTSAPDMTYSRQSEPEDKDPSWWQVQAEKFQSIELENKGSVARDHLAIERTFLAWLRTSLSFASIGIAVTQLFRLNTSLDGSDGGIDAAKNMETLRQMGKPLGTTFLGISILTLFLGYKRYFQSQHWVMQGKFPASRGTITIVAFVAFAIMVASLVVVIAIHPSEREL